jgi:hypothetical protein
MLGGQGYWHPEESKMCREISTDYAGVTSMKGPLF